MVFTIMAKRYIIYKEDALWIPALLLVF